MNDFFKQPVNYKEQSEEDKSEKQLLSELVSKISGIYNILLFFLWVFIITTFIWIVLYFAIPEPTLY